ncbi:MAG TPA: hypothetical protein VEL07_07755 [Planctomycetota bacterium]|nr:hypothetical protein [Planctomycetota bacterium]
MNRLDFHILYLSIMVFGIVLLLIRAQPGLWSLWVALLIIIPQGIVWTHVKGAARHNESSLGYQLVNEGFLVLLGAAAIAFRLVYA